MNKGKNRTKPNGLFNYSVLQNGIWLILFILLTQKVSFAQPIDITKKLNGFDHYMDKILKDWNIAGAGVMI